MLKASLSLVITTFNNADTLKRCLQSVEQIVDEIIVLDSYSTDDTLSILKTFNVQLQQQAFKGFGPQKQDAITLANSDWVLLLDADEALSTKLQEEIIHLKKIGFSGIGYRFKRREWLANKRPIERYGRWQRPGVKLTDHLRLFNRQEISFTQHPIHAAPIAEKHTPLLKHDLLHWGDAPFSNRLNKARRYADIIKQTQTCSSKSSLKRCLSPGWAFVQDYFLRRYFLDGYFGFKAAVCSFWQTYWKYHN